jgi:hypothetical protein
MDYVVMQYVAIYRVAAINPEFFKYFLKMSQHSYKYHQIFLNQKKMSK